MMDALGDIAVFVRVVRDGSFTRAAERLGLSRPVVSKYVSRLEERLGARLLNRTTRRLSLTEAGRVFYERSKRGLRTIEEAEEEVSILQGRPRGLLRINSPMSFGILHLAPALPDFLAANPEVEVDLSLDDRTVDMIGEGFDVSVRITNDMPDSTLVARRLGPCRHAVVASPSYLEQRGIPKTPEELKDHNIIAYRYQESALLWHFRDKDGRQHSVTVGGSVQMNNSLALLQAAIGGLGILRAPTFVANDEIRAGRLVPVLSGYEMLEVDINLVYSQRRHVSPKVRAFIDFMAERISYPPYWDRTLVF